MLAKNLMFIMLSGVPCSGKSTWRAQMVSELERHNIPVTTLSADDIAWQMCVEHNQKNDPREAKLTYTAMCTTYRARLEQQYKSALLKAKNQPGGIVILDRTYLTSRWREAVLNVLVSDAVSLVTFAVRDKAAWRKNLVQRNTQNPQKNISPAVIASLTKSATAPTIDEGFAAIISCRAIGEPCWEITFKQAIDSLISTYMKNHLYPEPKTHCLMSTFDCSG